jgi:outer membrane lipoprotein-sorting protein
MKYPACLICISLFSFLTPSLTLAEVPTPLPTTAPAGIERTLWTRMIAADAKAEQISDLTADFEQQKFTPLLKKPMVSTGTVLSKGSAMLWDTRSPEPTLMRVDEQEVRIYYPKQKTVEIYPIGGQLGALAASPLPRLSALLPHFQFAAGSASTFGQKESADRLIIQMKPSDVELREHVDSVTVMIDFDHGYILAFELIDSDGERTVIRFTDVKTNAHVADEQLNLKLPANIKIVRPLENLGQPPKQAKDSASSPKTK